MQASILKYLNHFEFIKNGKNYFGYPVNSKISVSEQTRTYTVESGQTVTLDPHTGLILK